MSPLKPLDAFCDVCGTSFHAVPSRTFIGFQKMTCPQCHTVLQYPLTGGYRMFYQFCAVGMGLSVAVSAIVFRHLSMPGLVGFAMIFGLIKDRQLRKEIAEGEEVRLRDRQHHDSLPPGTG